MNKNLEKMENGLIKQLLQGKPPTVAQEWLMRLLVHRVDYIILASRKSGRVWLREQFAKYMKPKRRRYHLPPKWLIRVNCDCASEVYTLTREPGESSFRRCRLCGKQLGCMEWTAERCGPDGKPLNPPRRPTGELWE